MAVKTIKGKNFTWINIDRLNADSLDYLKKNYDFHHLDFEDLQDQIQTPKIDVYKNYLFLVFHFPHWPKNNHRIRPQEVDVFIGPDYLITIQQVPSKEMKDIFYRCLSNRTIKNDWLGKDVGYLLYKIIDSFFHNIQPIIDHLSLEVSELESNIYSGRQGTHIVQELAYQRSNILNLRRIIDPQRFLVSNLSNIRKPFLDEHMAPYFDNINDYLSKVWSMTETFRDTINGLHVTVESLMTNRTNKLISSLTIISVSLMPLHLLAGIYGMNISGLPYANEPIWVWSIFIGLSFIICILIFLLRRQRRI
ncbi:MAG TPA: magnesium transporter CorA family protein [Patescibacteria group bacterium]|nr:magnesium transporter CorA family protein [Patescibacteria group bacterium]